jgi:phosphoribosylformylglycinamidine (FGAM) synthase PurS component
MLNEKLEADLLDLVSAIESACFDFKQRITQKHDISDQEGLAVSEANFNLNYTEVTSPKLGTFEIAEEKANPTEKWTRAHNILKQNNATISTRYHGTNYTFSYWLYNGKIYRQELKRQNLHG